MQPLNNLFPQHEYPNLLVGLSSPDDAAVYQIDAERAIVSTVDFFPPVVDDPYAFGAIAAANALSDIYAVGGEPLTAINLVAFPEGLDLHILTEILRGGAEKVKEAGAVIVGGHTIIDTEPKYGLAVNGVVHPQDILTKSAARPGDRLILTKPLGAGVVTTALKAGAAQQSHVEIAVASMSHLNRDAARIVRETGANAVTDVTGYSLLGHAHEMAHLSKVDLDIEFGKLTWLPGSFDYAEQGYFPGGMGRNQEFFATWVDFDDNVSQVERQLMFDPETSGGLLIAVPEENVQILYEKLIADGLAASIIGAVRPGDGSIAVSR